MMTLERWLTRRFCDRPIFVVGAPRSGTSILLQALGEHSQILSSDQESPFIPYVGMLAHPFEFGPFAFGENKDYHRSSLKVPVEHLYRQLRRLCVEVAIGTDFWTTAPVRQKGKMLGTTHWCAKTFPSKGQTEGLVKLFPSVRIIYVFRNGMDVVRSRSHFRGMKQNEFSVHCDNWAQHVEKYAHLFDVPSAFPLRQEDIAAKPTETFADLLRFVGVRHEDGPGRFAKSTLIHSLDKKTQAGVNVQKALTDRTPAYQDWTAEQREVFRSTCGEGMRKLGYEIPF